MKKHCAYPSTLTSIDRPVSNLSAFQHNFPTDQLFCPENWTAARACSSYILTHAKPDDIHIGLGNSISWFLLMAQIESNDAITPQIVAFSSKHPRLLSETTIPNESFDQYDKLSQWDAYSIYLQRLNATPIQWTPHQNVRIYEYSESGRGLISFLVTLHQLAQDQEIDPSVMFKRITCVVFRPQWSIEKYGHTFPHFPCQQETVCIHGIDAALDRICNDDSVRWVPSFNWFKQTTPPSMDTFQASESALQKATVLRDMLKIGHTSPH